MNISNEKSEALSFLSDCYKEAYGHRPTLSNYIHMSIEDIDAECDELNAIAFDNMEREAIEEEKSVWSFQALVSKTIKLGAGDEKTALKWLFEASIEGIECEVDYMTIEHFVWYYGIMHTEYGKEVINIVKQPYMNYRA